LTQEEQREHSEENINADGYEGGEDVNSGDVAQERVGMRPFLKVVTH
jgi:hypothetical protein